MERHCLWACHHEFRYIHIKGLLPSLSFCPIHSILKSQQVQCHTSHHLVPDGLSLSTRFLMNLWQALTFNMLSNQGGIGSAHVKQTLLREEVAGSL
jgi:hypothetical protein